MKVHLKKTYAAAACGCPPALRRNQRGIALVVTLILLSVVTFLAVAFLFLARRERGSVATQMDLTAARRGTEAATDHASAQIIASIIDSKNQFNYGLIVSTNFINKNGFVPGANSLTNVNYDYLAAAGNPPLSQADFLQNVANLFYSPRPPVFVRTNRAFNALDFRFYHDLNHSGRYDTNGSMLELLNTGRIATTTDANGNRIFVTNFYVGDPEWVGVLERPDRPHSSSNKFVFRYCFIVVPSGKTLDVNSLHNQSKQTVNSLPFTSDGFSRNMGVGPWELNLASFLVDLNTNVWERNPGGGGNLPTTLISPAPYFYDTTPSPGLRSSTGTAFEDAVALTRYRYGVTANKLKTVVDLFGNSGAMAFQTDGADDYGSGPLLLTNTTTTVDGDTAARVLKPWPGAENPNHFFTTQDLFDRTKTTGFRQRTPNTFSDRLLNAGYYGVGFYDRYTYYRLLSQMGTDGPPDPTVTNKIHLNYVNVDSSGHVIPDMQTNFVAWTNALEFFTNAADRLLRATFTDTNANQKNFGVASILSLTNIPVLVSNQFVYTPSLHRVLQVTANIWESTTMNRALGTPAIVQDLPSVFRPVFRAQPNPVNPAISDIYINGFVEVNTVPGLAGDAQFARPYDLSDPFDRATVVSTATSGRILNIYGVPWVIGAKKGLPNFNEFAVQSVSQLTRKLQVRRPSLTARPNATNQLFVLGVSNVFAFEAWNSYRSPFSNAVQIIVANDMILGFNYTNDVPLDPRGGASAIHLTVGAVTNIAARSWVGYGNRISVPSARSFQIPLQTNITFLPDSYFRFESTPAFTTNIDAGASLVLGYEQTGRFPIPQFTFAVSNRIRFIIIDTASQRVIDYVQMGDLNGSRNLSSEATESTETFVDATSGVSSSEAIFWQTNRPAGFALQNPPMGVINQIEASLGNIDVPNWNSFGIGQASGRTKQKEIDAFRNFMGLGTLYGTGETSTKLDMQAPFTPTRKTSQYITWQANDPLVHYTAGDLANLNIGTGITREQPNGPIAPIKNIGALNDRFEPWGGRPSSGTIDKSQTPASGMGLFALEAKDPGVKTSDDWDFPTNKFATLGLLGRVHRGTPWQTVYLKANDIDNAKWAKWTGNPNSIDAAMTRPVLDRALVDVFTTAIDQNSTRGQLNINQTGIAAWSALLGGVIGLTNASTEDELKANPPLVRLESFIIDPAGKDQAGPTNSILGKIHDAVDRTRAAAPFKGSFKHLGDILAVPELTTASPLLNTNSAAQLQIGINDAVYERLPQQLLGLMRGGDQPSFTIYAYGQALHPANRSIVTASGPYFGLCTNYQITAEFATRTVVEVENAPAAPKVVVKSYNILAPE